MSDKFEKLHQIAKGKATSLKYNKISILKKLIQLKKLIFLFSIIYSIEYVQAAQNENIPKYIIEKNSCVEPYKCSYDIRIDSKLSEDELLTIAYEIFDNVPVVNKVFMMFYLPCMKIGNGTWASIIFAPTPKIDIMDYMLLANPACTK